MTHDDTKRDDRLPLAGRSRGQDDNADALEALEREAAAHGHEVECVFWEPAGKLGWRVDGARTRPMAASLEREREGGDS